MKLFDNVLNRSGHSLYLHRLESERRAIQRSFFSQSDEKKFLITSNPNEFKELPSVNIILPKEIDLIPENSQVAVDNDSIYKKQKNKKHKKRGSFLLKGYEKKLDKLKSNVLCFYNLRNLNSEFVEKLVGLHKKLICSTGKSWLISHRDLINPKFNVEIERFVKNNLRTFILALLLKKPMCGTNIIKHISKKFNVYLSPGTVYPLLHELEKEGLLECKTGVKAKSYHPIKEDKIKEIVEKRMEVGKLINRFYESAL